MRPQPVCARRGDALEVLVKVTPGASRDAIGAVVEDGLGARRLVVQVSAKAEGNAANRAVVRLMAKCWRLPPTALEITAGQTSRLKRLRVVAPIEKMQAVERLLV
ncbi:MAG: DUF167 domain-containing protein [Pseudomonadota bacterium]